MRSVLIVLILAALVFAQLYSWWRDPVDPTSVRVAETKGYVDPYFVSFVWESGRQFELWENVYVVTASVLTPSGEIREQYYKRATFLVEVPPIDPQKDVKWYSPWEDGRMPVNYGIAYVFAIPIKIGEGPLYNWTLVPYYGWKWGSSIDELRVKYKTWDSYKNYPTNSQLIMVDLVLDIFKDGTKQICLYVDNRSPYRDRRADIAAIDNCIPWNWGWGRHNVTVVALNRSVTVYLDGLVVYHLQLRGGEREWPYGREFIESAWRHKIDMDAEPWIYVGPSAYYALQFYAWPYPGIGVPLKPLGNATLLVGNGTLSLPPYLYVVGARASDFDGFWLRALPPPYVPNADRQYRFEEAYLETPRYTVYFNETPVKLLKGTLLRLGRCNLTEGGLVPAARLGLNVSALVVVGDGRVYCPRYKVSVRLPNGTAVELWARPGEAVSFDPPPVVDLGNGTRLVDPRPVRVRVNYSDASVETRYGAREYLIRFATPLGAVETWAREGANATYPGADVDLGNGTRVVVYPTSVTAQRPMTVSPSYEVYYRVTVVTPFNKTEAWVKRGTSFEYGLPQFVDLGNGTALRSPNGTCAFYVDGPKECAIVYRERLYWVSVRAPFNRTEGWALEGSVVRLPEVFDLGNGTRWVGPGFYAVVDKPIYAAPAYKRQYYVEVAGVVEWRGWADEASQIRLNETVAGGVRYIPQMPFIEVRGALSVKPKYAAYYYAQFNDALGLPNPWASVELCGQRFVADEVGRAYARVETDSPCEVRAESSLLGPYSLAVIGAVAIAAVAVSRLKKRK